MSAPQQPATEIQPALPDADAGSDDPVVEDLDVDTDVAGGTDEATGSRDDLLVREGDVAGDYLETDFVANLLATVVDHMTHTTGVVNALEQRDFPLIQATVLVTVLLALFVQLLVDLLYPFMDPRVRLGEASA